MNRPLRTLERLHPHPVNGTWREFLDTCEVRDEHKGTVYYGSSNCNYIVLPNNLIIDNYGYHGRITMHDIREKGWRAVLATVIKRRRKIIQTIQKISK